MVKSGLNERKPLIRPDMSDTSHAMHTVPHKVHAVLEPLGCPGGGRWKRRKLFCLYFLTICFKALGFGLFYMGGQNEKPHFPTILAIFFYTKKNSPCQSPCETRWEVSPGSTHSPCGVFFLTDPPGVTSPLPKKKHSVKKSHFWKTSQS